MDKYLQACFIACTKKQKPHFTIVQICCVHFIKIVLNDLKRFNLDETVIKFYKWQLFVAINISDYSQFYAWLQNIFILLMNATITEHVQEAREALKASEEDEIKQEEIMQISAKGNDTTLLPTYRKSPFYIQALKLYCNVKKKLKRKGKCK